MSNKKVADKTVVVPEEQVEIVKREVKKFLTSVPRYLVEETMKEVLTEHLRETIRTQTARAFGSSLKYFRRTHRAVKDDGPISAVNLLIVEALFILANRVARDKSNVHEGLFKHLEYARRHLAIAENWTMAKMKGNTFKAVYGTSPIPLPVLRGDDVEDEAEDEAEGDVE